MDCIFCKIIAKEIPSKIVYEDEKIIAFHDVNPMAPVHALIVPKVHTESLNTLNDESVEYLSYAMSKVNMVADMLGVKGTGYRTVINTGDDAGQTVKHLHIHILGGTKLPDKMA